MGLTAKPQDGQNIGAFGGPQWVWVPEVGIGITLCITDVHIKHLAQFLTQKTCLENGCLITQLFLVTALSVNVMGQIHIKM